MTTPYYSDYTVTLHHGDCLDVLRTLPDASVDAVCTDPPYALREFPVNVVADAMTAWLTGDRAYVPAGGAGFMGRDWDRFVPPPAAWDECMRVLKPGGHLLAFAAPRTADLMTMSIRLAGFEIRDGVDWIYASGFPKSLDVSKAIDKTAGAQRKVIGSGRSGGGRTAMNDAPGNGRQRDYLAGDYDVTAPATEDAARWSGWGTALKPAREPIVMARKPLAGTVAGNVLAYGTGALNIDACRTAAGQDYRDKCASVVGLDSNRNGDAYGEWTGMRQDSAHTAGRWPTNVVLSHSQWCEVCECGARGPHEASDYCYDTQLDCLPGCPVAEMDKQSGGASRFFPVFRYEAKAPTAERPRAADGTAHPTVKPLDLMRWLVRLVTPAGGVVLEPFAGSGTTAEACVLEGFRCTAIEREAAYLPLITARLAKPLQPALDFDAVA